MSKTLIALTSATTPLAGTESMYVVQGGNSRVTTAASFYTVGGTDVAVADGGTGLSSYTAGDMLYATGATTLAKLASTASYGRSLLTLASSTALSGELSTFYQPLDTDLTSWAGVTRASGFDTFAAGPTSANLKALLTDETGSGAAVFATSPTLVTPALGTPSALVLTNATGLPFGGANFTIDEDDMASDSATKIPTQQSVKAYVDRDGWVDDDKLANPSRIYNRINQVTFVDDLGASPSASSAVNTQAVEDAQQEIITKFGQGKLIFGHGTYLLDALNTTEIVDNEGTQQAGNTACIIQRPGISFEGQGRRNTTLKADSDGTLNLIFPVSPLGQFIRDIGLDGSWDGTHGAGHGIIQFTQSDYLLANLITNGDLSGGTTAGWTVTGDGVASVVSGRLRLTRNATVTTPPRMNQSFTTIVGRNYRVSVRGYKGTSANGRWICAATSTGGTGGVINSFVDVTDGITRIFNFVATTTTTWLLLFTDNTGDANAYCEFDDIKVTDFPIADQQLYVTDYAIERCLIQNVASYGIGIENGDISGLWLKDNWIYNAGADGIDCKGRGPSGGLQPAMNIINNYIRKFGQRTSLTGQSAIDLRGQGIVAGNHIEIEEKVAAEAIARTGIRLRPPALMVAGVPLTTELYGATRSRVIGNYIKSDSVTVHDGITCDADYGMIDANQIWNTRYGVQIDGSNLYATTVESASARGNTAVDCTVGFRAEVDTTNSSFQSNTAKNCGTAYELAGAYATVTDQITKDCTKTVNFISGSANNEVQGGRVLGTVTTKITDAGTSNKVASVKGIATRNRVVSAATAIDTIAATVVDIPYALDVTPSADDVLITVQNADSLWRGFAEVIALSGTNVRCRLVTTTAANASATAKIVADINTERL